jgi:hypothetical protein
MAATKNLLGWFLLLLLSLLPFATEAASNRPIRHWLERLRAGSSSTLQHDRKTTKTKRRGGRGRSVSWFSTNGGTASSSSTGHNSSNTNNSWLEGMGLWANADDDDDEAINADPLANVITPQSDLSRPGRSFHIVTTASLPWFTGTAVNPLLRAAHLYQRMLLQQQQSPASQRPETKDDDADADQDTKDGPVVAAAAAVTLVVPWLEERDDQEKLYGRVFRDCHEQEDCLREFLRQNANMPEASRGLQIRWYPARYHAGLGSIFAMGDILECCKGDTLDVCILEEPEHW